MKRGKGKPLKPWERAAGRYWPQNNFVQSLLREAFVMGAQYAVRTLKRTKGARKA